MNSFIIHSLEPTGQLPALGQTDPILGVFVLLSFAKYLLKLSMALD